MHDMFSLLTLILRSVPQFVGTSGDCYLCGTMGGLTLANSVRSIYRNHSETVASEISETQRHESSRIWHFGLLPAQIALPNCCEGTIIGISSVRERKENPCKHKTSKTFFRFMSDRSKATLQAENFVFSSFFLAASESSDSVQSSFFSNHDILNKSPMVNHNDILQHVPVCEVSNGVGTGADGWLYPGVPLWIPLALLAPAAQCLRLLQVPGTGECPIFFH